MTRIVNNTRTGTVRVLVRGVRATKMVGGVLVRTYVRTYEYEYKQVREGYKTGTSTRTSTRLTRRTGSQIVCIRVGRGRYD